MRRRDREITDLEKIKEIITKATVVHLAMVDSDEAYVVPVNFGYEENCLYFHSAIKGHKIDLLKKNNRVCFSVYGDYMLETTPKSACKEKYRSVTGRGRAHFVEDNSSKIRGLNCIMRQCSGKEYPITDDLDEVLVIRIDIENLTGKQAGY
jgi:hypothetical protein